MESAGLRGSALARLIVAGLSCCLCASCGGSEPTDPAEPPAGSDATFAELFGSVLLKADGSSVGIQAIQTKAIVGIYFAAGWCPACAEFTPTLVSAYGELTKAGKSFEIVLVSLDASSADMLTHMRNRGMAWLAIPYDSARIRALIDRYGVEWIPTLVILDNDRTIITKGGRDDIVVKGAAAFDDWLAASRGL